MDSFGDLIGLLVFVVFIVIAIARKIAEQRDVTDRQQQMKRRKPEDLPEATRRMLYGDTVPTARPRGHNEDGEDSGRPVVVAPRREPNVQTAQPRQGQPRRVTPPPVAPQQSRRQATPAPPRPAPPPRRVSAQQQEPPVREQTPFRPHEEKHRQAAPPMRQQPQQTHRREAPPPPVPSQQVRRRAPRGKPIPRAPVAQRMRRPRRAGARFFDDRGDLRKAIIMCEILGPPKAFE